MRSGPKVSPEQLENKILNLEAQIFEYAALLLASESYVRSINQAKFILMPRYQAIEATWRTLIGREGPIPNPEARGSALTALPPIPAPQILNPTPSPPPPKPVGRPTKLSRMLAQQDRDYEERGKREKVWLREQADRLTEAWGEVVDIGWLEDRLRKLINQWDFNAVTAMVVVQDQHHLHGVSYTNEDPTRP